MRRYWLQLSLLALCSPAWATLAVDTGYPTSNNACSGTTCAITITSTTASHMLVVGMLYANSAVTISSVTAAVCTGTWTHAANANISASGKGGLDMYYCTNVAAGKTSVTITSSGTTGTSSGYAFEASSSLGTIAINSGATPSGNINDAACTSCAGVALTLSNNNSIVIVSAAGSNTITGLTGSGFVDDLSHPLNDGVGHLLNNAATSLTSPTTWTHSASGTGIIANALAIQETGGGAACTPTLSLIGVGRCG